MSRGIGVGSRRAAQLAVRRSVFAVAACSAVLGYALPVIAGDVATPAPSTSAGRFNEAEMLDAARRAAANGQSQTVNIGVPPADELRVLESRREAELKRLSEKLKRAAEARGPKAPEVITTPAWTTEVVAAPVDGIDLQQRSALGAVPATGLAKDSPDFGLRGRATILMVMAPTETGRPSNPDRAADPILCVAEGCYVSNGPQAPASYHSFGQSLSLAGRVGRGAGACNHTQACVFRNVDLGTSTSLVQPIDLKLVRHDRREQREATIDSSCRVIDGRLSCSRPVRTSSYTLWVVPEHVAREIGSDLLANAVGDGLRTAKTAELPWVKQ